MQVLDLQHQEGQEVEAQENIVEVQQQSHLLQEQLIQEVVLVVVMVIMVDQV
jgi:hypothetical protein